MDVPASRQRRRRTRPNTTRRSTAPGGAAGHLSGAYETTQRPIRLRPEFGPVCRIPRTVVYDWTLPAADQAFLVDFSLGDVPNVTEFTTLFRQWRLRNTRVTIDWRSANENTPTRPVLYFGVDPFMASAPTTLADAMQRPHRTWTPNATRTVLQLDLDLAVVNLVASGPGVGALVTNSLAPKNAWFDTSQATVAYGVFWCWVANWRGGFSGGHFTITQDFLFEFRGCQ